MTAPSEPTTERVLLQPDTLPATLSTGATILVASDGDPTEQALGLQLLSWFGGSDDTALVVTTDQGADQTVSQFEHVSEGENRPSLGLVDTVSKAQSLSSLYGEPRVVFTPSNGDLTRLVVGLAQLSGDQPPSTGERHLLVRSLTPILETTDTDQVCSVLQQITGVRTEAGISVLGLDCTAHERSTITALGEQVEGILWVTSESDGGFDVEYQPTNDRRICPPSKRDTDG